MFEKFGYQPTQQDFNYISNFREKADAILEAGLDEAAKKNWKNSVKLIENAQKMYLELNLIDKVADCLSELALTYYRYDSANLSKSLALLNDAGCVIKDFEDKNDIKAKVQHYLGSIYFSEKRFSDALKYLKNALKLLNTDDLEYARILETMAVFYLRMNNQQIALNYLETSLEIKKKNGSQREMISTYLLIGRYYSGVENNEKALEYLIYAREISESINDTLTLARIEDELAKLYIALEDLGSALEHCNRAIEISKNTNIPFLYAFACCTLANIKINLCEPSLAVTILEQESYPIFNDLLLNRGLALVEKIKGLAYQEADDMYNAKTSMSRAIELFKNNKIDAEVAKCYWELSKIYKAMGETPQAVSCLFESYKIAIENNLSLLTKKIEDGLFELNEREWAQLVNKKAQKQEIFTENKSVLNSINLLKDFANTEILTKNPLLSLLKIGRAISAETDLYKLLLIIAEETKKALNADRCTVFLLDKETNEIWSKVALGMGSHEIRFPSHLGLAGHVMQTGETINIRDAYNDDRFNKEIDKQTGYRTKTILCMPMRNMNHEIMGVFQVLNKLGDMVFTDDDESLLLSIGSSASIAIENANLFKKQQQMYEDQKKSFNSFIDTLAVSIDARDKITAGHSKRVTGYAVAIGKQMQMSETDVEVLEYSAMLHDFGKIGIKDSVLCKKGKLTDEEYKHIQEHASITNEILKRMFFEEKLKAVPEIASSHHEKYNGFGYYRNLKGEEIPLGGRILAVSDVFDAITSKRHYRERMPFNEVLNILRKDSWSHFDGNIVDEFFKIDIKSILEIMLSRFGCTIDEEDNELFTNNPIERLHEIFNKDQNTLSGEEKHLVERFTLQYNKQDDDVGNDE